MRWSGWLLLLGLVLILPMCTTEETEPAGCTTDCSYDCGAFGRCTVNSACECTATTDDDCLASQGCREAARCTLVDDVCALASDADCRASSVCTGAGRCTLMDGICIAVADADCESSRQCTERGCCEVDVGGWCALPIDAAAARTRCLDATVCAEDAACEVNETSSGKMACCNPMNLLCLLCQDTSTPNWPDYPD